MHGDSYAPPRVALSPRDAMNAAPLYDVGAAHPWWAYRYQTEQQDAPASSTNVTNIPLPQTTRQLMQPTSDRPLSKLRSSWVVGSPNPQAQFAST